MRQVALDGEVQRGVSLLRFVQGEIRLAEQQTRGVELRPVLIPGEGHIAVEPSDRFLIVSHLGGTPTGAHRRGGL